MLDEILDSFLEQRKKNREPIPWSGTATQLMQDIFVDDILKGIVGRNSARWFGINLGKLEAQGRGVESKRSNGKKIYIVGLEKKS